MGSDVSGLHHVGLVVDDMGTALATFRRLGFALPPPSYPTMVVIDQLESQHLVERRPHPTDRRAKQLLLTAGGVERRGELLASLRGEELLLTSLTRQELATLQDLLQRAISRH